MPAPLDCAPLARAIDRLAEGVAHHRQAPGDEQPRDGLIQRCAFTFALAHRRVRRTLKQEGTDPDAMSFAERVRACCGRGRLRAGRFSDRDPETAAAALGDRIERAVAPWAARSPPGRLPSAPGHRKNRRMKPLVLLTLAALAGCAAPAPKPPPPRAAAPDWDGAYHGTSTRFRAAARDCPHPGIITLYVAQGEFYVPWSGGVDVLARIGADGTITGGGPGVAVTGHVRGKALVVDAQSAVCGLHYTTRNNF